MESNEKFHKLVLSLTDRCNMACTYCCQKKSNRDMSYETLGASLKYFKGHAEDGPLEICFYGGEPLLVFWLIKKTVELNHSLFDERRINYMAVTNGLLLGREEIMDFLVNYNIHITVSLDGPPSVHDRCRRDKNGRGTHAAVLHNLNILEKKYPQYYYNNVLLQAVLADPGDAKLLREYFRGRPAVFLAEKSRAVTDEYIRTHCMNCRGKLYTDTDGERFRCEIVPLIKLS